MLHFIKTLKFIKNLNSKNDPGTIVNRKTMSTGKIDFDLYEKGFPEKSILLVHGMAPDGNKDYRIINICNSLALCGYRVISPFFKQIAGLIISSDTVDDIHHV